MNSKALSNALPGQWSVEVFITGLGPSSSGRGSGVGDVTDVVAIIYQPGH